MAYRGALRFTQGEMMVIVPEHGVDDPAAPLVDNKGGDTAERPKDLLELCTDGALTETITGANCERHSR